MKSQITTANRILDASRRLFNDKGYAATTLTEIATDVGISQGNLTYHFPTKRDLVLRLEANVRQGAQARRANQSTGDIADDYVEHLLFAMDLTWDNRFLLRDRAQFAQALDARQPDSELSADFDELFELISRIGKNDMFRQDVDIDPQHLTRSLWIVSRYWMDYLRESEGLEQIGWADQERGIQHHFAVLLPCLTASARRDFKAALDRLSSQLNAPTPTK